MKLELTVVLTVVLPTTNVPVFNKPYDNELDICITEELTVVLTIELPTNKASEFVVTVFPDKNVAELEDIVLIYDVVCDNSCIG